VYLPTKLIGELEEKKRAGVRSKFIKEAIQEKISRVENGTLDDWSSVVMLCCVRDRLEKSVGYGISRMESDIYQKLLQMIIDYYMEANS
jgi:metal-responsive CopG/Arc/MetJ family transcriptional regulator